MTALSSLISGGGGVPGGVLKFGAVTVCPNATDTTVLNLTTTSGTLWGIRFDGTNQTINDVVIKMTVDGAAEQTLDLTSYLFRGTASSVGFVNDVSLPLPRRFNSAITLKVNPALSAGAIDVFAMYTDES